jgi:hypothetical protein
MAEPSCYMKDTSLYDPKIYDEWDGTAPLPEVKRIIGLIFKYCPDGKEHDYQKVPEESYMCDTLYKCTRCGKKMRVDSSD